MRAGLNHYTLHQVDEPMERKLDRIALAGYEGVEIGVSDHRQSVLERLEEHSLDVACLSVGHDALAANDFEEILAACEDFECSDIRTGKGTDAYSSPAATRETAAELEQWAERAAAHDLTLHCHNHDHEFVEFGEQTAYDILVAETDALHFELDVGWVGAGGQDPIELLARIGDRVTRLHVKDMDFAAGEFRTFGEGDLDVESLVETAERVGVEWGMIENDDPIDPIAELAHASMVLDQYTDHICQ